MSSISDLEVEFLRKATGNMGLDSTISDLRMEFYRGVVDSTINVGGLSDSLIPNRFTGHPGDAELPNGAIDVREHIQRELDKATSPVANDNSYYAYLRTNAGTVRLSSGNYYVSAPEDGTPSLRIPEGVHFDTSDANMFFDFPASPTFTWCAIEVNQYGSLAVGRLMPAPGTVRPDDNRTYDCVRLNQTDNNTRVFGSGRTFAEISGFDCAIRGVGAWITYIEKIRITDNYRGYVASNVGDGTLGYTESQKEGTPFAENRVHTDLYIKDCQFVNLNAGGIIGPVTGDAGNLHGADYANFGLTLHLTDVIFESIGDYALNITSALNVSLKSVSFEECGNFEGMNLLDNIGTLSMEDIRVNFYGRPIAGPDGSVFNPYPPCIYKISSVRFIKGGAQYVHNLYLDGLKLFSDFTPLVGYNVLSPYSDVRPMADDIISKGPQGSMCISRSWERSHLVMSDHHIWVDDAGKLRAKNSAPTSSTDGTVIGTQT